MTPQEEAGPVLHWVVGPDGHGVTEHGRLLAEHLGGEVLREGAPRSGRLPGMGPVLVSFTDHLFGQTPQEAVDRVLTAADGRRLALSLHDVPQPAEGADRFRRRAAAYRRLASAAALSVVNSEHEAAFFADGAPAVIRLPIPSLPSPERPGRRERPPEREPGTVGILGFLYPGKGHEQILRALAGTGARLRALGAVSAGHDPWAEELRGLARRLGVDLEITGFLPEEDLVREMQRIMVPVCAHRHYSASGSLMTWIAAGRRVLASESPYTREMAAWLPQRIRVVEEARWPAALRAGLSAPPSTSVLPELPVWGWPEVAARWQALLSVLGPDGERTAGGAR